MKLLVVEDEGPKRENILTVLEGMGLRNDVAKADSVASAIRSIRTEKFDLVILDMSLPTFDIAVGEDGGRPQGFGGVEVLRYMDRFKIATPVIVVTAYPAFSQGDTEIDLKSLREKLKAEHPSTFHDLVLYNSMFSTWRDMLREKIEEAISQ